METNTTNLERRALRAMVQTARETGGSANAPLDRGAMHAAFRAAGARGFSSRARVRALETKGLLRESGRRPGLFTLTPSGAAVALETF